LGPASVVRRVISEPYYESARGAFSAQSSQGTGGRTRRGSGSLSDKMRCIVRSIIQSIIFRQNRTSQLSAASPLLLTGHAPCSVKSSALHFAPCRVRVRLERNTRRRARTTRTPLSIHRVHPPSTFVFVYLSSQVLRSSNLASPASPASRGAILPISRPSLSTLLQACKDRPSSSGF
jgi:hypothetical protein